MGDSTVRRVRSRDSMMGGDPGGFCCSVLRGVGRWTRRKCFVASV